MSFHAENAIEFLVENGLIVSQSDGGAPVHHITKAGRDAIQDKRSVANKRHIQTGTMTGTYDGRELRHRVVRAGAYDFLQAPSLIGDQRVFRKGV